MKVILYMAMTVNGYIAKENDDTSFVSPREWKSFNEMGKRCGNYVMGRRTFEVSLADGSFPYPDRLNVVLTKKKIKNKWGDQVVFANKSPRGVMEFLKGQGFRTVFVGGGARINAAFMRAGLVDEIYLDVEPLVLGKGIPLFRDGDFQTRLKLLDIKKLSPNLIQLHYKTLK